MIRALITGTIYGEPQARTSQAAPPRHAPSPSMAQRPDRTLTMPYQSSCSHGRDAGAFGAKWPQKRSAIKTISIFTNPRPSYTGMDASASGQRQRSAVKSGSR